MNNNNNKNINNDLNKPKIAVYSIAKNEEQFVDRYYDSCKDADLIIVGVCDDTSDNTKQKLLNLGVKVIDISVHPWKFDVARNLVLNQLPDDIDIAISLDLDEVLLSGWRETLEELYEPDITKYEYYYVFSWYDEQMTKPRITHNGFKIHKPKAYRWKYPIHEILEPLVEEKIIYTNRIRIHHYPDYSKERKYQELLDQAVIDYPDDSRMSYLRGRELFIYERYEECIKEFNRYLHLSPVDHTLTFEYHERASAFRYIAQAMMRLGKPVTQIIITMMRAVAEAPLTCRESWVYLGELYILVEDYHMALISFGNALNIRDRSNSIEIEEECWNDYRINKQMQICQKKLMRR